MEAKHTPGPWYHDFASGMRNGSPQVVEYFVRRDGDNVSIAADIVDPEKCAPSEANARLIAAAPELLAALNEIVIQIDQGGAGGKVFARDACITAARAAIAKATGATT